MARKITLSIPDRLHEKITQWRSSFNFSQLFQEALIEAIEKKERFKNRFKEELDMPLVIQRLKNEKLKWGKKYFEIGKTEALGWVKTAQYETLVYVTAIERCHDIIFDPKMSHYFQQIYQSAGLVPFPTTGLLDQDKKLIDGWYAGFFEFWNQVKDKI